MPAPNGSVRVLVVKAGRRPERRRSAGHGRRRASLVRPMWVGEDVVCEGTLQDISAQGLSLLTADEFRLGTVLALAPPGGGRPPVLLARVVRTTPHDRGGWL